MKLYLKILMSSILIFSCSTKVVDLDSDPEIIPEDEQLENIDKNSPFYPLKESQLSLDI